MTFDIQMNEEQARWVDHKLSLEIALYVRVKADGALDAEGQKKLEMMQSLKTSLDKRFDQSGESS